MEVERSAPIAVVINHRAAAMWRRSSERVAKGFKYKYDREYHSEHSNPYCIATDAQEEQRQNFGHHLVRHIFGGQNYAGVTAEALSRGLNVLDVGFGSGIWLAEMHREFPAGTYYGIDFFIGDFAKEFQAFAGEDKMPLTEGDVLKRIPHNDASFDYVHQQLLVPGIPHGKWPKVIAELGRVVKPGGYIDLIELDSLPLFDGEPNSLCNDWTELIQRITWARGIDIRAAYNIAKHVEESGLFEDVQVIHRTIPVGGWEGVLGEHWKANYRWGFQASADYMSESLGITKDEWNTLIDALLESWENARAYMNMFRVTARRRH